MLAASIRHTAHMLDAARLGSHVATLPHKVLKQMVQHPLTDKGNIAFLKYWETVPGDGLEATVRAFLAKR